MRAASSSLIALAMILGTAQAIAQSGSGDEADARWRRLQAERAAEAQRQRDAQQNYEQGVRESEAARARYEAEVARHNQEIEQARRAQARYDRDRADYDARMDRRARRHGGGVSDAERQPVTATRDRRGRQCQQRQRRRSPFSFGFGFSGAPSGLGNALAALPVALVLTDAITRMLDCREQEQASVASEQAVDQAAAVQGATARPGQRGTATPPSPVGTSVAWTSESRPGVTGSSTVTGLQTAADGSQCMTVTDIVIVDGQETRAPKTMCRRPPSQRFVRV